MNWMCNGGGERAEEDLIGRTVLAERRMAFKVPEGLNIGDLQRPEGVEISRLVYFGTASVSRERKRAGFSSFYWVTSLILL